MFKHIVIASLLLSNILLFAQSPFFKTVSIKKSGRPSSVSLIVQDSKGYLWLSSSEGLILYDGIETIVYGSKDSLDASIVTAIFEDNNQILWFGHKNGAIEYFQNDIFQKFVPEEGLGTSEITFISADSNGTLWFGTMGEGVYYFMGENRKRLYNINSDDGLSDNYVYTMAQSANGNIFLGSDNGICIIDSKSYKVSGLISMKNGLPDNIVKHLIVDENKLWIGMDEKGVCIYNLQDKSFSLAQNWKFGTLSNFTLRNKDEAWASTKSNGIVKLVLRNNTLFAQKQYTEQNGLPSDETTTIYTDRESNIWGGSPQGLFMSATSAFEFIDLKSEGIDLGIVYSFIEDSQGQYWSASEKGLIHLTKDNNGKFSLNKMFSNLPQLQSSFISLYQDTEGFIWAGTYGFGVYRIDPSNHSYHKYTTRNGLSDDNILYITGKGQDVWMATAGGGAILYNVSKKTFINYNSQNGLESNYLYSIYPDSKGNVWFATDGRNVSVLKKGKEVTSALPDSLDITTVYSVMESRDGSIWFLTSDKGLLRFNNNRYKFYTTDNGLLSNNIRSICADSTGNLLIVENEGIQLYLYKEDAFETFGAERGVAFLEPNLNGISLDREGNIWISTSQGVVMYSSQSTSFSSLTPKIGITKTLLFFEPINNNIHLFKHNENHITFEYSGFWYQAGENIQYRFKLENYDFDWGRNTQSRSVTYSNLPPGEYTFKLEVSHKPGKWISSNEAVYKFEIRPPFYQTWWFITICVLFIAFSVLYYIKARTSKLIRDKELLELEVQKRTATILHQIEEIEAQRNEIEAQRDFVTNQRDQIVLQNDHIKSSIEYASRIQQALLTPEEIFELKLRDFFILNSPMDIVSGDFYWLDSKNNKLYLTVADCTGHGVPGAFMSILGMSFLEQIVNIADELSAAQILNSLRDKVKYALRQTGKSGENQDGMDIALLIVDFKSYQFEFAGANNPLYIVRNGELNIIKPDKMPIGIFIEENPFRNQNGRFEVNDMVYLFSDGYVDQFGGPKDTKFKNKAFQNLLLKIATIPVREQRQILHETMKDWKRGNNQNDDILVLGFRVL